MSPVSTARVRAPGAGRGGPPPGPPRLAERAGNAALLLLLGVLAAVVVLVAWQFAMQTSFGFNASERVHGASVVLRELPASLLLFAPVIAGLVLGVRAARLGARRGLLAVWLHALALFLALFVVVSDTTEGVMDSGYVQLEQALLPAEALIAAIVATVALRHARPRMPASPAAGLHWRRAAVLALGGIAGGFVWLGAAQAALSARAGSFARAVLPGSVSLNVTRPGVYYLYVEGNAPDSLAELTPQITGPAGQQLVVRSVPVRASYLHAGRGGRVLAEFTAAAAGGYRITAGANLPPVLAPYAPANANGDFAVGAGVAGWMRPHEWGTAALLVIALGSGVVALRGRAPAPVSCS